MKTIVAFVTASMLAQAAGPPPLQEVLRRTGRAVEEFWRQFSAINCIENVSQTRLDSGGKPVLRQDSTFDYLIVLQLSGRDLVVEESRVPVKAAAKDPGRLPLLVTSGFSTFVFVFHPLFQGDFEYSQPAIEQLDGADAWRIDFRHTRGGRSPSVLKLRQREYPIPWQGTAWIDPESGSIRRIAANIGGGMEDLGLKTLNADVRYRLFTFKEDPGTHWLPVSAAVEAETRRQHWLNLHTFTNYRHFSVTTNTSIEAPK